MLLLKFFLYSWSRVTTHLYNLANEQESKTPSVEEFITVILSIAFFYTACYLIQCVIEDWIELAKLRHSNAKYLVDYGYNSNSTPPKSENNPDGGS